MPWGMKPMIAFTASGSAKASIPPTQARPPSQESTPAKICRMLVLPAPSGPTRPRTCPLRASKPTPRTASTLPRR